MNKPTRKPQQARSLATRDKLNAAAKVLFTARGYQNIQAKTIAQKAGVSIGTFYQYFPDKKAAFRGVLEDFFQTFQELIVEARLDSALPVKSLDIPELIEALDRWTESYGILYRDLNTLGYTDSDIGDLLADYEKQFIDNLENILGVTLPSLPEERKNSICRFLYLTLDALLSTLRQEPLSPEEAQGLKQETSCALVAYLDSLLQSQEKK